MRLKAIMRPIVPAVLWTFGGVGKPVVCGRMQGSNAVMHSLSSFTKLVADDLKFY